MNLSSDSPVHPESHHRRAVRLYVVVVLGLSALHWLTFYLAGRAGWRLPEFAFGVLRSYGPTIAAIAALLYLGGRAELSRLWTGLTRWRLPGRLYLLVLVGPLVALAGILAVARVLIPEAMTASWVSPLKLLAIVVALVFLDGPLGEEPGWRGYLLPALLRTKSAIVASVGVALVWFAWHLPLYHADGKDLTPDYLAKYLLYTLALSFLHTWLFRRSGGSVLLNVLFHNMTNAMFFLPYKIFPALASEPLYTNLYLGCALVAGALAAWSLRTDRAIDTSPNF